jgi:hypothetical protein
MSMGIGVGVGLVIAVASGGQIRLLTATVLSGCAGLSIHLGAQGFTALLGRRLKGMAGGRRKAAEAGILLASGCLAWLVIEGVAWAVFSVRFGGGDLFFLGLTAALAVAIGLAFFSFGLMRERLEASVARLKEAEFAEKELEMARDLQRRLLPPSEHGGEGYRVGARNLAARVVAGDFYDVFSLGDGALCLVVADVVGKGMAAALIMATVKAMLPFVAAERSAAETLRELNRRLARELPSREFVALALARFDPLTGALSLANAGLPDPYLVTNSAVRPLEVPGPRLPLGVRAEVAYDSLDLHLSPGQRLVLLTDGLAEAPDAAGEPLGYAALAALMRGEEDGEAAAAPPLPWIDALLDRLRLASGPSLADDWTVLVLERLAPTAVASLATV